MQHRPDNLSQFWALLTVLAVLNGPCPAASGQPTRQPSESYRELLIPRQAAPPTAAPPTASPRTGSSASPAADPAAWPMSSPTLSEEQRRTLEAQVRLASLGLSPGSIDGAFGPHTRAALRTFQRQRGIAPTGILDAATAAQLANPYPALRDYVVTEADLCSLQPVGVTWLAKSEQTRLDHETLVEKVAERTHASPALIRKLNPSIDWTRPLPGVTLRAPNVVIPEPEAKAAFIRICLTQRILQAFDAQHNLLVQFPCSIGQETSQRPVGQLHVQVLIPTPNYTFNPQVFPESEEARRLGRKLIIPPGPNNPVGTVWIGLDRPGYGIHGTPRPETVGRAESHGCFRLANWNAEHLMRLCWVAMPVYILEECRNELP